MDTISYRVECRTGKKAERACESASCLGTLRTNPPIELPIGLDLTDALSSVAVNGGESEKTEE